MLSASAGRYVCALLGCISEKQLLPFTMSEALVVQLLLNGQSPRRRKPIDFDIFKRRPVPAPILPQQVGQGDQAIQLASTTASPCIGRRNTSCMRAHLQHTPLGEAPEPGLVIVPRVQGAVKAKVQRPLVCALQRMTLCELAFPAQNTAKHAST